MYFYVTGKMFWLRESNWQKMKLDALPYVDSFPQTKVNQWEPQDNC